MNTTTISTRESPARSLAAFAAGLAAGQPMDGWEAGEALTALLGDESSWARDPAHLDQAATALTAAWAAAHGDERALARAVRRLAEPPDRQPAPPQPVDPAAVRAALAAWPAGLPVHPALAHPALAWDAGTLSVVAAPTSAGKTTVLLAQVLDWLSTGAGAPGRVLVWSGETPGPLLIARLVGMRAGETLHAVREQEQAGLVTPAVAAAWTTLGPALNRLVVLDDTADMGALELARAAQRLADQPGGLAAVVVDYIQELPMGSAGHPAAERYERLGREAEVGMVARTLRRLATELAVPVVAAAQFNRTVNKISEFVPDLLQLRESGRIEQNAGLVIGLRNETMSQAAEPPAKAPTGWAHTPSRSYSAFGPPDTLAAHRLGAQIAARETYGVGYILGEAFILKNRWRGGVGTVIPFALQPATGQLAWLAQRYEPPATLIARARRGRAEQHEESDGMAGEGDV